MIEPTQEDIGRKVAYTGHHGSPSEEGVITSFNEAYVFVRYGSKCHSEATVRSDLEWVFPKEKPSND